MEIYIVAVLGAIWGVLGAYALYRLVHLHDEMVQIASESIDDVLNKAQTDEEFQKRVYVLGGLLGKGLRAGLGVGGGGGNKKFGIMDLAMQFIGGKLGMGGEQPQPQFASPRAPQTKNIPDA